jgi:hypothetical protein
LAEAVHNKTTSEASHLHPLTPVDVGLQIERTTLSWRRTFLSGCVALAGILKTSMDMPAGWDAVIVILAGVALVALIFAGRDRESVYRHFEHVDGSVKERKRARRERELRGDRADHTGYADRAGHERSDTSSAALTSDIAASTASGTASAAISEMTTRAHPRGHDYSPSVSVLHWGWALTLALTLSLSSVIILITIIMGELH